MLNAFSVRLIIMQVQQVLVGSCLRYIVLVCMSVYYVPFWHVPLMMQSHAMEGVQWLTTQQKYERQQDNSDRR